MRLLLVLLAVMAPTIATTALSLEIFDQVIMECKPNIINIIAIIMMYIVGTVAGILLL